MNRNTNISEEELDNIECYILNNMSPKEHVAFTLKLSHNADLKSKVNEVRLLLMSVEEAVLQEELNAFHKELPAQEVRQSTGKVSSLRTRLAAASLILFCATGVWLFLSRLSKEEKLFSEYFKPDSGLISAMSTSDNYPFDRAMVDY